MAVNFVSLVSQYGLEDALRIQLKFLA